MFAAFVAGTGVPAPEDEARVTAVLAEHVRAAREAWPDLAIDPARFAGELGRRFSKVAAMDLSAIKAADVHLAAACLDGKPAAVEAVRQLLTREVGFAATKTTATREQIADVVGNLSRILFVDEPERPAALREYSGRGDLKSYLRVMAMRDLTRVVNRGRREVGIEDDGLIDRLVPATDPELSILRAQYRDVVDQAMRAALASLDERNRALLRYAFIDGWNVDRVGEVYNVHRATAARWIAAAREKLGERIRDELASRLKIEVGEIDSIVRLVQSRIDVSLDRVLRADP